MRLNTHTHHIIIRRKRVNEIDIAILNIRLQTHHKRTHRTILMLRYWLKIQILGGQDTVVIRYKCKIQFILICLEKTKRIYCIAISLVVFQLCLSDIATTTIHTNTHQFVLEYHKTILSLSRRSKCTIYSHQLLCSGRSCLILICLQLLCNLLGELFGLPFHLLYQCNRVLHSLTLSKFLLRRTIQKRKTNNNCGY